MGKGKRTKATPCPACARVLDGATSVSGDHSPCPGDFSVCFCCGELLRFDSERGLQLLRKLDLVVLDAFPDLRCQARAAQLAVKRMLEMKGPPPRVDWWFRT